MVKINRNQYITKDGIVKRNPQRELPYKKVIIVDEIPYKLGLVTKSHVYYYGDEEDEVLMYDRKMKLISDNNFGVDDFVMQSVYAIKTGDYVYIDKGTKYNAQQRYNESPKEWNENIKEYRTGRNYN